MINNPILLCYAFRVEQRQQRRLYDEQDNDDGCCCCRNNERNFNVSTSPLRMSHHYRGVVKAIRHARPFNVRVCVCVATTACAIQSPKLCVRKLKCGSLLHPFSGSLFIHDPVECCCRSLLWIQSFSHTHTHTHVETGGRTHIHTHTKEDAQHAFGL